MAKHIVRVIIKVAVYKEIEADSYSDALVIAAERLKKDKITVGEGEVDGVYVDPTFSPNQMLN